MPSTVFDSAIFRDAFGSPAMREVFSDAATVARYVEVEVALAAAEARVGVIPKSAAETIAKSADAKAIDLASLKAKTDVVGYPIVGLVSQLAKQCGDAGGFVHWGATTQDIMDTGLVLQVREALALVDADLAGIEAALAGLARKHRDTVMAGRTHMQHALPVTFGYKAAVWLSMVRRHRQRLAELKPRVLVGQFGGAAGTLASLGDKGLAVHDALMDGLQLGRPPIAWHVARDGLAETVSFLGLGRRHAGQDRHRHHADDADRGRRGLRAVPGGSRLLLDHAAEAQPDRLRVHPRAWPRWCASRPA